MSFFDWQQRTAPLMQEVDDVLGTGTGEFPTDQEVITAAPAGDVAAATEAAKTDEELGRKPRDVQPEVIEPQTFEHEVLSKEERMPPEVEEAKPQQIATVAGQFRAPPTEEQAAVLAQAAQVGKEMEKRNRLMDLSAMAVEQEMMDDAAALYEHDHAAADELIGRAMARYRNRTEQLDRDMEALRTTNVEPNRIFGNMTAAGRFAAALNVAVGQMAATAAGGPNAALGMFESAIERDMLGQQQNQQNRLAAVQQGRALRAEEYAALQEELALQDRQRALAFAYARQQIARKMAQTRTQKARDQLQALDTMVAAKEVQAILQAQDSTLSAFVKAPIYAGARGLERLRRDLPRLQQFAREFHEGAPAPALPAAPEFEPIPGMPVEAPEAPVEAAPAPEAPTPPAAPTEAAMAARRASKPEPAVEPEAAPVEEAPVDIQAAPVTPAEAEAELQQIMEAEPTMSPSERVASWRQRYQRELPQISARGRRESVHRNEVNQAHRQWRKDNRPPELTDEEFQSLSDQEKAAYQDLVDQYNYVKAYPEVMEVPWQGEMTEGDKERSFITLRGLTGYPSDYRVTFDSDLRWTGKTKRGTKGSDLERQFREDAKQARQGIEQANDVAQAVENIGIVGAVDAGSFGDATFRVAAETDDDGNITGWDIKGLGQEDEAKVVQAIKALDTRMLSLAAKFVKDFDPTSRLSDQDMRIAMRALGISSIDALMTRLFRAAAEGNDAVVQGYADFIRAFGEMQLKKFANDWTEEGVIFPPNQMRRQRTKLRRTIQNIQSRERSAAEE